MVPYRRTDAATLTSGRYPHSFTIGGNQLNIRFIRDQAATEDDFGGHDRAAGLLVELVDHRDRPRLIGLLGSWGSGKSTVLGIAKKRLLAQNPTSPPIVFTFDAWMHQSDPPRRAFIEALVAFLVRENLGAPDKWKEELDAVQKRVETHDITNSPLLSGWAIAIAFALLLLPLGVRLSTEEGWIWLGWIIIAAPFSLAVVNWWAWRRHRWPFPLRTFFTKKNFTTNRRPYRGRSIASIFVSRSTDKTVNTILKTPEPTSIEFRKTFSDVLSKLDARGGKVVFILDNLDRISPDDAFTIWSTFRSLFAEPEFIVDSCGIDFRVVIPIDYNSLKRIYAKALESGSNEDEGVQSLIEKSFDVVLRVPPPVQSDWIKYVKDKVKLVAAHLTDQEIYNCASIFASSLEYAGSSSRVTPRQINNYANRIAGELAVADSSVSAEAIFYYAAFGRVSSNYDIRNIIAVEAPGAAIISRMDKDWRAKVAALHFGVDKDRALQLLIGDEVKETILAENEARLTELAQLPGFDLVVSDILRADVSRGPYFYGALAGLLSDSFWAGSAGRGVWTLLRDTVPLTGGWDKLTTATVKGVHRLAADCEEPVLAALMGSLSSVDQDFTPEPLLWLDHVQAVIPASGPGRSSAISRLAVPSSASFYVAVIWEAAKRNLPDEVGKVLRPRAETATVMAQLAETLSDTEFSSDARAVIAFMKKVDFRWDWSHLIAHIRTSISEAEDLELATNGLRALLIVPNTEEAISGLGTEGHLSDLFAASWAESDTDSLSVVIEAICLGWASLAASNEFGESVEGQRIMENLDGEADGARNRFSVAARSAISRNSSTVVRGLLRWSTEHSSKKTILSAIEEAFANSEVGSLFVADAVPYLINIARSSDGEGQAVIRRISTYSRFWEHLSKEDPNNISLVLSMTEKSSIDHNDAVFIQSAFEKLDASYWRDVIENNRSVLRALDGLIANHPEVKLGPSLAQAHDAYINDVIGGNLEMILMNVSWRRLLAASAPDALETSVQQALDLAETGDVESKEKILQSLDDGLLSSTPAKKDAVRIVTHVVLPLLRGGSESALRRIVQKADVLAPIVKRMRGRNRDELVTRIEALRASELLSDAEASTLREAWSLNAARARVRKKR